MSCTICCKWPDDLKFTLLWERASIRRLLQMRVLLTGNWQFLLRWFRDGFSWSSYYLRLNVIPANSFWVKCVRFCLVMTEISVNVPATSGDFRRISEDFRTLPKIKCPQMFPKTFEQFRGYLKDDTFRLLWYDFVRIQKRTQSHHVLRTICPYLCVRREKLSLMRDIDVFSPQA